MEPLPRNRSLVVWRKNYINPGVSKLTRTICEVLRELHRDAELRNDSVSMSRIEEANDMAKRMQNRLKYYALKMGGGVTLVSENGEMIWLTKAEYRAAERAKR